MRIRVAHPLCPAFQEPPTFLEKQLSMGHAIRSGKTCPESHCILSEGRALIGSGDLESCDIGYSPSNPTARGVNLASAFLSHL